MIRSWLRRTLASLLGVVFAASMSVSTVQATEMAAKMSMASAVDMAATSDAGRCPDCDHSKSDAKATDCRPALCGTSGVAALGSSTGGARRIDVVDVPVLAQASLIGWAHAPDPYPPRT
jgi:hypothetical protein